VLEEKPRVDEGAKPRPPVLLASRCVCAGYQSSHTYLESTTRPRPVGGSLIDRPNLLDE
jgi:hypothetical protein